MGNLLTSFVYYVDPAGNDANAGTLASPWRTLSKVNGFTLVPGVSVGFKRGGVWREFLNVPTSGTADLPITFGAYGTGALPIFSGCDVMTGWGTSGSNFTKAVGTAPRQVFQDGVPLTLAANVGAMAAGFWFWDGATLFIRMTDGSNPSGHTVEVGQRDQAIYCGGKSHLRFQAIQCERCNFEGVFFQGSVDDIVFDSVKVFYDYIAGIGTFNATPAEHTNNVTIQDSEVAFSGGTGIAIGTNNDTWLVQRNQIHDNCRLAIDGNQLFTAGIRAAADRLETNIIVQDNIVWNNGVGQTGDRGAGIWMDTVGSGCIVRRNICFNNKITGVMLELDLGSLAYGNVCYNHTANEGGAYGYGILVQRGCNGAKVYNNTGYANRIGMIVMGDFPPQNGNMVNNDFRNNLFVGSLTSALVARYGAENDTTHGSGNVYSYNGCGPQAANFIEWGAGNFLATYTAFQAAYGVSNPTHALVLDPMLIDAPNANFLLHPASPAIGAGTFIAGVNNADPPNLGARGASGAKQNSLLSGYPRTIGAHLLVIVDHAGPTSYTTGGESLTAGAVGVQAIDWISLPGTVTSSPSGYVVSVAYQPGKLGRSSAAVALTWRDSRGVEVPAGFDLSAESIRLNVIGGLG